MKHSTHIHRGKKRNLLKVFMWRYTSPYKSHKMHKVAPVLRFTCVYETLYPVLS